MTLEKSTRREFCTQAGRGATVAALGGILGSILQGCGGSHGSQFSTSGRVLTGPAPASLAQFTTRFSNNVLTIS